MKKVTLIILLLSIISCANRLSKLGCDFDVFEKISGIVFPEKVEIIDCDNTTHYGIIWLNLKFDQKTTIEFIEKVGMHEFNDKINDEFEEFYRKSIDNQHIDFVMSIDNKIRPIPNKSTTYLKKIETEKQHVIYIIDKESGLFWGLIQYPE